MSVTPTKDLLVVSLDFEGVFFSALRLAQSNIYMLQVSTALSDQHRRTLYSFYSIRRSPTWSVATRASLSWLCADIMQVLLRNNFAMSRDITGLFQSFQSSSTVLDPEANPSLFQSTLVIIIKVGSHNDTMKHQLCSFLP